MELHHTFTVPADPGTTWQTFMDLEGVAGCFPGAVVTGVDGDSFTGTVKVKLGPIALQYAGQGRFVERDDATHKAVIEATGKDKRGNGTAGATATITVSDGEGGGSSVEVVTDLAVTGKPAQFGRGVMQDVSDKLLGQFVACLERRFTADEADGGSDAASAGAATAAAPEPAAPAVAAGSTAPAGSSAAAATTAAASGVGAAPAAVSTAEAPVQHVGTGAAPLRTPARPAPRPAPAASEDDALDLGSAVIPVLLRSYGGYAAAAVVGILLGWLLGRSRSR
ncbi:SRPBCC family protein [Lapillicoccus jejuensis]|uniref:SRPBCC family protein n=1 Tax=Lapillicoccus jejuensis TaxID=402171 RepID=UPI0031CEDA98